MPRADSSGSQVPFGDCRSARQWARAARSTLVARAGCSSPRRSGISARFARIGRGGPVGCSASPWRSGRPCSTRSSCSRSSRPCSERTPVPHPSLQPSAGAGYITIRTWGAEPRGRARWRPAILRSRRRNTGGRCHPSAAAGPGRARARRQGHRPATVLPAPRARARRRESPIVAAGAAPGWSGEHPVPRPGTCRICSASSVRLWLCPSVCARSDSGALTAGGTPAASWESSRDERTRAIRRSRHRTRRMTTASSAPRADLSTTSRAMRSSPRGRRRVRNVTLREPKPSQP